MSKTKTSSASRRNFLKFAGAVAPAVMTGAVMQPKPVKAAPVDERGHKGLQDTAHIRHYYETARF